VRRPRTPSSKPGCRSRTAATPKPGCRNLRILLWLSGTISGGNTPKPPARLADWEKVLFAAAYLQQILPDAVLVGGTASALHAGHRVSLDADHVVADLAKRFDAVLAKLESVAGWKTSRIQRPVQILGNLDSILTGVRQLTRKKPLQTQTVRWRGQAIKVPTPAEMLRIKAVLILDYLDFIAMSEKLGEAASADALRSLDRLYPQPNGESPLQQLVIQLASPLPYDLEQTRLNEYKRLVPRWHDWKVVKQACARGAISLFDRLAGGKGQSR
jgi:hypothetical protein